MRKVTITGMGCVTAAGMGVDALWQAARDGRSGVRRLELARSPNQRVMIAAPVPDFEPEAHLDAALVKLCDRFSQIALVAADEAMAQAGLSRDDRQGDRTAVIIGSGIGGATSNDDGHHNFYVGNERPDPMTVPRVMPNAAASQISIRYGCTGPSFAVSSACSSASQSIGMGFQLVRSGAVDRAIVGGSEALLTPAVFRAWEALRVLTPDACRPFSKGRNGMVLGEGAAVLVIEAAEVARARQAAQIAHIAGYGTTSDANDIVRPDVNGPIRSMRLALADAGIDAGEVGYINAHGTGTILNDVIETAAVQEVFAAHLNRLAVSATKPIHGHTLGAGGAIELVIAVKALAEGVIPPTINWIEADPKCNLDVVPNEARCQSIDVALSNSFAFGGINASLVVRNAD